MMKLHLTLFLILPAWLSAQSTPGDSDVPPERRVEIGLNITNTITNVVGSSTNNLTTDPYLLSLRFGEFDRRRWRLGLNFRVHKKSDTDVAGFLTDEKESTANLRFGHEWVRPMSRNLAFFWGLDGVFEYQSDKIETTDGFGTALLQSQLWGVGGGPVLGLQWRVHPRVALSTECSIYAVYHTGHEEVNAPPDVRRDPVSEFEWRPLLPSSLFVHFAF